MLAHWALVVGELGPFLEAAKKWKFDFVSLREMQEERGGETEIRIMYAFSKLNESKGGLANMSTSW